MYTVFIRSKKYAKLLKKRETAWLRKINCNVVKDYCTSQPISQGMTRFNEIRLACVAHFDEENRDRQLEFISLNTARYNLRIFYGTRVYTVNPRISPPLD